MTLRERWAKTSIANKLLVQTGALVAFGTVFYAGAAVFQICVMKESSRESAAQVERLVGSTNDAINKAVRQAGDSVRDALRQNREAMDAALVHAKDSLDASGRHSRAALVASVEQGTLDRRAWIAPQNAYVTEELSVGKSASVELQYGNVGREPALDVHPIFTFKRVAGSEFSNNTFNALIEADDVCKELGVAPGADVIYPAQPGGYKLAFGPPPGFVTKELVSGDYALVLEMCFAYKSGSTGTETHRMSLCYFYRPGVSLSTRQMNICTAGNHTN